MPRGSARRGGRPRIWTRVTILTAVRRWEQTHERWPTVHEWRTIDGLPTRATVWRLYGSLGALRQEFCARESEAEGQTDTKKPQQVDPAC